MLATAAYDCYDEKGLQENLTKVKNMYKGRKVYIEDPEFRKRDELDEDGVYIKIDRYSDWDADRRAGEPFFKVFDLREIRKEELKRKQQRLAEDEYRRKVADDACELYPNDLEKMVEYMTSHVIYRRH